MTGLFRLLFFIFVIFIVRLVMHKIFALKSPGRSRQPRSVGSQQAKTISGRMVKDPQCGTHVATELAVPLWVDGTTYYFCSQACLDEFKRITTSREVRVPAGHV